MNRMLIFSDETSDLSDLILKTCPGSELWPLDFPSNAAAEEAADRLEAFDAFCVLAGNSDGPRWIPSPLRAKLEEMRSAGRPVFYEFIASIGGSYMGASEVMTHHRMAYLESGQPEAEKVKQQETQSGDEGADAACQDSGSFVPSLGQGDILDGHYNDCIQYVFVPEQARPVLVYHDYLCAHDHVDMTEEELKKGRWALFWMDDNTLVCSMRLCNFVRARLAPEKSWQVLIADILSFLAGERVSPAFPGAVCTFLKNSEVTSAADVKEAVKRGLNWFRQADMLVDGGAGGVREGLSHHIYAKDGVQMRVEQIRTDCTAETGGAFGMDGYLHGEEESRKVYEKTGDFVFRYLQVKEGLHKGMLRWSETAWQTCYQDDAARVILPALLEANYGGGTRYFAEIKEALDYMVNTTGKNGLRRSRTDSSLLDEAKMAALREEECELTCTHYNGFYLAALLLAYRAGGPAIYREVAEKGLTSIMNCYPDNVRETSETEENCRLILPLAVLYQITGKQEHKDWLYRVAKELQKVRHESGAYREWDTGYRANCSRREAGECALLAQNGDPVADMLYSVNWLPLGFAYAYLATKDPWFYELWCAVAGFFVSCQIHSEDKNLDGAWTRAFDLERWEIYGVPHDVGWAPCCVETGWTMGEILMGLQFMELVEKMMAE